MYDKFKRQSKWWKYAAWTAPFISLAALIGSELLYLNQIKGIISMATVIVFIAASVFWWWWAMDKMNELIHKYVSTEEKFVEIKDYIKETKDLLEEHHERDREWREQK